VFVEVCEDILGLSKIRQVVETQFETLACQFEEGKVRETDASSAVAWPRFQPLLFTSLWGGTAGEN